MRSSYLQIKGGHVLKGTVELSGAKNAILPLIFASLLAKGEHQFTNVPQLKDVEHALKILNSLGIKTKQTGNTLIIKNTKPLKGSPNVKSAKSFRASVLCLGPLLALCYKFDLPLPGGCQIGSRPIDLHIRGLNKMGAKISIQKDFIKVKASETGLKACSFLLNFPSVGATENLIMASVLAQGVTCLENIACEPEILDLINYLKKMGAKIKRIKKRTLEITGVKTLKALDKAYPIIPDRIEAGTWLLAGACTRGEVRVKKCQPKHLTSLIKKLEEAGFKIETKLDQVLIKKRKHQQAVSIKTGVYPAFPTDLQSQFMALMTSLKGKSLLKETIFENRFRYVEQLNLLGANIQTQSFSQVSIKGPCFLKGNKIKATDLRAGAGLILAALIANKKTQIYGLHHIERGYENLIPKLQALGADIQIKKT